MVSVAYGVLRRTGKAAALVTAMILPASAQEITIAAMGDSLTAGYGVPNGQGFVPQLEAWLRDRGHDVAVLNAGVSGDTTAGGLRRVDWTLSDEVDAMILALGGNDLLRGLPPEETRSNLDAILTAAADRGVAVLLAGLSAPGNYGSEYQAAFDAIFPELATAHGALYVESFLGGLEQAVLDGADPMALLQDDGIHPSVTGVAAMVAAIGPEVEALIARVE